MENLFGGSGRLKLNFKLFLKFLERNSRKKNVHFQQRFLGGEPRRRLIPNF